jgi:hypothetical protein
MFVEAIPFEMRKSQSRSLFRWAQFPCSIFDAFGRRSGPGRSKALTFVPFYDPALWRSRVREKNSLLVVENREFEPERRVLRDCVHHQVVCTSWHDFLRHRIARHSPRVAAAAIGRRDLFDGLRGGPCGRKSPAQISVSRVAVCDRFVTRTCRARDADRSPGPAMEWSPPPAYKRRTLSRRGHHVRKAKGRPAAAFL